MQTFLVRRIFFNLVTAGLFKASLRRPLHLADLLLAGVSQLDSASNSARSKTIVSYS